MGRGLFNIHKSILILTIFMNQVFFNEIMFIRSHNLLKDIPPTGRKICNAHSYSSLET